MYIDRDSIFCRCLVFIRFLRCTTGREGVPIQPCAALPGDGATLPGDSVTPKEPMDHVARHAYHAVKAAHPEPSSQSDANTLLVRVDAADPSEARPLPAPQTQAQGQGNVHQTG